MKKHIAYIGIGSNINPADNINKAIILLKKYTIITGISTFYITKAINKPNDNNYLNGVIEVKTNYRPFLLKYFILKKFEKKLGRLKQSDKFASRTIDLDLILYDDLVIKNRFLKIPDKDIYTRNFIAYPLYELNPDLVLHDSGKGIKEIINSMNNNDIIPDMNFTGELKKIMR